VHQLRLTGDTRWVDWCMDVIEMFAMIVHVWHFYLGCGTTCNEFTPIHVLSVWDYIARYNTPMPMKQLGLNHISSKYNIWKVISITPSTARFLLVLFHTVARLRWTTSDHFWSTCWSAKHYRFVQCRARRLNNGYYTLKLNNTQW
jgi:hypothetical protein